MTEAASNNSGVKYYFVDEAGDPTLFGRRGKVLVGSEGCSKFFILGKLDVSYPEILSSELTELRLQLLADPYFQNVPSMQSTERKTALAFHAKDDLPEVRREVFKLLLRHDVQFYAVVRDKTVITNKVLDFNKKQPEYRYHPNQLYDRCVAQLFKERLHKDAGYSIFFARRGNSDRTESLEKALQAARTSFRKKWGIAGGGPIEILPGNPPEVICLQAVDYFLWSLQRLYEKAEDRFLNLLWPKVRLIIDCDDTRTKSYGVYYTQTNPLSLATCARK
ncbi:MAG: DUF3800 domain-containing protein [Planctomycetales bacterium]